MAMSEIMLDFSENPDKVSIVLLNINIILSEKAIMVKGARNQVAKAAFRTNLSGFPHNPGWMRSKQEA